MGAYILAGILSGLIVFAYIFVFKAPKPEVVAGYGGRRVETNKDGWLFMLVILTFIAVIAWPVFWPAMGAVKIAQLIKAKMDARSAG